MKYKWLIKESSHINKDLIHIAFGSEIIARLLLNRGINTKEKAITYLYLDKYIESSPYEIPSLDLAKNRILKAIENKEKITIFGDYDVDGVTSTACLLYTLKEFTNKVDYYIPSRLKEGYGLNKDAVEKIQKKHKAKLLITCDCGVTNHSEIEHANSLGIDVIVTDHHSLPDPLPNAYAVLNPKLLPEDHKLHHLPGVGVAYKLAEALLEDKRQETTDNQENSILNPQSSILSKEDLLDLVTLGMIADLAPLVDENRYLVQIGLPKLANTKKIGLQELLRICGIKQTTDSRQQTAEGRQQTTENQKPRNNELQNNVNTDHVGFGIAPRINAVGRLTDANLAVKLLTTKNLLEAVHIATELDIQNKQRQMLCEQTLQEACLQITEEVDLLKDRCIVLANDSWHHGVIGIVASRIVEKFGLPTILIAIDKEQDIARGSGRSTENFNIALALNRAGKSLEKFGGHKAACGLSIKPENIEKFIFDFKEVTSKLITDDDMGPTLKIDCELPISFLSFELINLINKLSPFGLGNPTPVFESNELEVVDRKIIGKDGQHLKLYVKETTDNRQQTTEFRGQIYEALVWNYEDEALLNNGDKIKLAYSPKINHFNGETQIQLQVKDLCKLEEKQEKAEETSLTEEIQVFDFRTSNLPSTVYHLPSTVFFAETKQKDFLPLKTHSRNKIPNCEKLIFLEIPPDENTFLKLTSKAKEIYLAFPKDEHSIFDPHEILKRLIGMLKYAEKYKNSKVNKEDLESALGLSNLATSYAIETLVRTGLLQVKRDFEELSINILPPSRQSYTELVEYTLFENELKQINSFSKWMKNAYIEEIEKVINQKTKIKVSV